MQRHKEVNCIFVMTVRYKHFFLKNATNLTNHFSLYSWRSKSSYKLLRLSWLQKQLYK